MIGKPLPKDWDVAPIELSVLLENHRKRLEQHRGKADNFQKNFGLFLSNTSNGDILVEYCTPNESWDKCMGHAGFAIIRNGIVVASIATKFN